MGCGQAGLEVDASKSGEHEEDEGGYQRFQGHRSVYDCEGPGEEQRGVLRKEDFCLHGEAVEEVYQ